jgi:hypothetical protein
MNLFIKALEKIYNKTLTCKFIESISSIYKYIKDYLYISDTFYSDELKIVLKKYLHLNIKKDWIGRLYGILNPNLDINGNLDINNIIIEIDGDNTNNNDFVKTWTYKQLNLISNLFKIENLYNYIDLTFEHVGPENHDNYLLIFDVTSRKVMVYHIKRFLKHLFVYAVIFGLYYFFIFLK